jgi:hypothetical protein
MSRLRQEQRERELERELRSDLDLEAAEQEANGLSPQDAPCCMGLMRLIRQSS